MRELLLEEWLSSVEEGELHMCCNSASKKQKDPIINIFTWLQGYASLVRDMHVSTAHRLKVPELIAYQACSNNKISRDRHGCNMTESISSPAAISKDPE